MSVINDKLDLEEKQKLEKMFVGDKGRDASAKIRGFLYQDLVAIDRLLAEETEYVCLEFLEDVNVFCSDDTLVFIQVKYYPKSDPDMEEIMTDLYYQYLSTEVLGVALKSKMQLLIHGKNKINKPDLNKMKTYVNCSRLCRPEPKTNPMEWLSKEVYVFIKKAERKKILFDQEACDESISCFLENFEVIQENDIVQYQRKVIDKLGRMFPDTDLIDDEERREKILLGLAIGYVQKRYISKDSNLDKLKFARSEFLEYIRRNVEGISDEQIVAYLTSIIGELYASIIANNIDMKTEDIELLNHMVSNTRIWISELAATKEGQYTLFNTISYKDRDTSDKFRGLNVAGRMLKIAENNDNFQMFLKFLWKIMLDLCQEKKDFCLDKDADMLDPRSYINASVTSYICIKFLQDFVDTSVILPPVRIANKVEDKRNICSRMYLGKPRKWYMSGGESGRMEYSYSTATIADDCIGNANEDTFWVECLKCIKVDMGNWSVFEKCKDHIFASECIGG